MTPLENALSSLASLLFLAPGLGSKGASATLTTRPTASPEAGLSPLVSAGASPSCRVTCPATEPAREVTVSEVCGAGMEGAGQATHVGQMQREAAASEPELCPKCAMNLEPKPVTR